MAKNKYVKSPMNYTGGKYKLLPQILPLIPENINTFVDLFTGGANVAVNVNAKRIIANDIESRVIGIYKRFQTESIDNIINKINCIAVPISSGINDILSTAEISMINRGLDQTSKTINGVEYIVWYASNPGRIMGYLIKK